MRLTTTLERRACRQGIDVEEVQARGTTRTAKRITMSAKKKSPAKPPGPMMARMGGNKLVGRGFGQIPAGRMTIGDRMRFQRNQMKSKQSATEQAQNDIRRRRAFGLGLTGLERFAMASELLKDETQQGTRDEGSAAKAKVGSLRRSKRFDRTSGEGFIDLGRRNEHRKEDGMKPSSGYGILSGDHTVRKASASPGKKRRREGPLSKDSPKRRKEREIILPDVIDLVGSSDEDRPALPEKKFSLSKRPKRSRANRTALVALSINDEVFDPQIGGSPKRSSSTTLNGKKPTPLKQTGGGSRRPASHVDDNLVGEGDLYSGDDAQTDNAVDVISSFSDEELNPVKSVETAEEKVPTGTSPATTRSRKMKCRQSVLDLTAPSSGNVIIAHGRTSPLPVERNFSSREAGSGAATHKHSDHKKLGTVAVPTAPGSVLEETIRTRSLGYGKRKPRPAIELQFSSIRAYPAVLDCDDTKGDDVEQIVDGNEIDLDVASSRGKNGKEKKTIANRSISPSTFYGSSTSKRRNQGSTSPGISPGRKNRRRRRKKPPIDCSDDEVESTEKQDVRLRGLSRKEYEEAMSVMKGVEANRVIAHIKEANIELRGSDFSRLRGSRWLSDELINSFVALINSRNSNYFECPDIDAFATKLSISEASHANVGSKMQAEVTCADTKHIPDGDLGIFELPRPRVHIFNTFFFARLTQGSGYDYPGVKRWLKRTGKEIPGLDLIMFPINISNLHWVLAAIDLRGRTFLYFDSAYGSDTLNALHVLRQWLKDEVRDKCSEDMLEKMDIDSWKSAINPQYLPRQHDHGSCGLFTLFMAEYLERGMCPNFTQDDILVLRRRTALFLKHGLLPEG